MKNKLFKKHMYSALTLFAGIALSILFFFLIFRVSEIYHGIMTVFSAISPLIYGAVIAYLLYPLCLFIEKYVGLCFKKMKNRKQASKIIRAISIFLSFVFGAAIVYFVVAMIVPQVYDSIKKILDNANVYINKILDFANKTLDDNKSLKNTVTTLVGDYSGNITDLLTKLSSQMGLVVQGISSGVVGVVVFTKNFLIGIIVAIYLLAGRGSFKKGLKYLIELIFNKRWARAIKTELRFSNDVVKNFIFGRILDSAIIGVLCFIGMRIIGIPYAVLVSVLVGITNIIPFFGPFIGGIPAGILILIEDPMACLWFAIFIFVLQQIDGNIIGPGIVGDSLGLSSFWVLFAMLLFGGLFGFGGLVVGVPVFAIIYDVVGKLLKKAETKKKLKMVTVKTLDE